jgi:hypothetical protein
MSMPNAVRNRLVLDFQRYAFKYSKHLIQNFLLGHDPAPAGWFNKAPMPEQCAG